MIAVAIETVTLKTFVYVRVKLIFPLCLSLALHIAT